MGLALVMLTVNGNLVCGSVTGECLKRRSSLSYHMFFILIEITAQRNIGHRIKIAFGQFD